MVDAFAIAAHLGRIHGVDPLDRPDVAVGVVVRRPGADEDHRTVAFAALTREGVPHGANGMRVNAAVCLLSPCAPLPGERAGAFVTLVREVAAIVEADARILEEGGAGRVDQVWAYHVAELAESFPDATQVEVAEGICAFLTARMEACGRFLDGLDPWALSFARDLDVDVLFPSLHPGTDPHALVARAWEGLCGGTLADAVQDRPAVWDLLAEDWLDDPARFASDRADGGTERILVRSLRRRGVPGTLAPWLGTAAEAMALVPTSGVDRQTVATSLAPFAAMPPEWVPRDAEGWLAYMRVRPMLRMEWDPLGGGDVRDLIDAGRGWAPLVRRLMEDAGTDEPDSLPFHLGYAVDVSNALGEQLVLPCLADALGTDALEAVDHGGAAARVLNSGQRIGRVLAASRAWHVAQGTILEGILALPWTEGRARVERRWEAGLPGATYGDVDVVVLVDEAQLAAEGARGTDRDGVRGLSHCVGGYAAQCAVRGHRILSVRRRHPDGRVERLATAEVALSGDALEVHQASGPRNVEPDEEVADVLLRYVREVWDGTLTINRDALKHRFVPHEDVTTECGYDWRIRANREAVWDLWRPHVPRHLRSWDLDRLAAALVADARRTDGSTRDPGPFPWAPGPDRPMAPEPAFTVPTGHG